MLVEVYSKDDCHLCDKAISLLHALRKTMTFELSVIKLREGEDRYDEFKNDFPAIFIDGKLAFRHFLNEESFRGMYRSAGTK